MNGKLIRRISVIIVMAAGVLFCAGLWIGYSQDKNMIVPAVGFTGVYIWFILMEIWGILTTNKRTLSTRLTSWIESYPLLGLATLSMFTISMIALSIHFGWFWD